MISNMNSTTSSAKPFEYPPPMVHYLLFMINIFVCIRKKFD